MNKTLLLIKHEFTVMIWRKGFIILTLAIPVLALLGILAMQVIPKLTQTETPAVQEVGYIDQAGIFTDNTSSGSIILKAFDDEEVALEALLSKEITEYYVIPPDYLENGLLRRYTLKNEIEMSGATSAVMRGFLLQNLLRGNDPAVINRVAFPMNVNSTTLTASGEIAKQQGGFGAFILPYIFSVLLMISIFSSSGYLLQGLGEEKENRVMEILLSSVSSGQLLLGKVLGLGAAGLVQILVWLVSAAVLVNIASSNFSDVIGVLQISPEFIVLGITYFMLGYLLVAVLMAGLGAIAPTAREGNQMSVLFTLPVVIPIYFMPLIMEHPENVFVKILTFIPITAPLTVIIRLGLSEIPFWEIAVSISILALSIVGCFILARKLFRTYLLMYGKRPDMKEIFRSFRNA